MLFLFIFSVPSLTLENPKGLSNQQVDVLKEELEVLAKKLVGEVCIGVTVT